MNDITTDKAARKKFDRSDRKFERTKDFEIPKSPYQSRKALELEAGPSTEDFKAILDSDRFQDLHAAVIRSRASLCALTTVRGGPSLLENLVDRLTPDHFYGSDTSVFSEMDGRIIGRPDGRRFAPMQKTLEAFCAKPPINTGQALSFLRAHATAHKARRLAEIEAAPAKARSAAFFAYAVMATSPAAQGVQMMMRENPELRLAAESLLNTVDDEVAALASRRPPSPFRR